MNPHPVPSSTVGEGRWGKELKEKEGQKVWIQVADTGMGLTVDEQAKLFQRFYRGDPSRSRPRGIGLGLAISNERVRLHRGTIFVSSEVNRGTTFRVELPG